MIIVDGLNSSFCVFSMSKSSLRDFDQLKEHFRICSMAISEQSITEAIRIHGVSGVLEDLNQLWDLNPRMALNSFAISLTSDNFPDTERGILGLLTKELRRKNQVLMPTMIVKPLENDKCIIRIIGFQVADLN